MSTTEGNLRDGYADVGDVRNLVRVERPVTEEAGAHHRPFGH